MKRHLIYCLAIIAIMTSCVKEPTILRRLPAEDAAAIPYQKGQTLDFVNENGDTLTFTVVYDEMKPFSIDYWDYADDLKMEIIQQPWCYARTVVLTCQAVSTSQDLIFTVIPEKYLYFRWNYELEIANIDLNGTTETITVDSMTYENVRVDAYTNPYGDYFHLWYYNEEVGLIAVKDQNYSLTLVP